MMKKNILIIGASGEIGQAIAGSLALTDHQLLLHYNQGETQIKGLIQDLPEESVLAVYQSDLNDEASLQSMLHDIVFPIDAVIFVSGISQFGLFQETTTEIMDTMLNIHVKAPWLITRHFLKTMIKKQSGKFIFITSIWGEIGASNEVVYSSVKGAQNSFIKALSKEVGPSGISVNGVSPGYIKTKMNAHLNPDEENEIISDIPLNRAGTAKDVANTVRFLMSDESSYIQGEIIKVTGGW